MMFVIAECHNYNYVYSREVLSELCLLSGSVIRMIFTFGECYQNGVHHREVLKIVLSHMDDGLGVDSCLRFSRAVSSVVQAQDEFQSVKHNTPTIYYAFR